MNSGEVQFGYISIFLSLLIGIFCLRKIRSFEVHGKEPLLTLGLVVVYGGLASILIALIGYRFIGHIAMVDYSQWYRYVVIVGPLEESAKLLGFLASLRILRRHLVDPIDGLVYMSAVALGFSLIENFTYANTGNSTEHLLFVRVALSTPAHILSSLPIGLAGYFTFQRKINSWWILPALLAASLIHGLYDIFCTLSGLIVVIYLAVLWVFALSVLRYFEIRSPYRKPLREHQEGELPPAARPIPGARRLAMEVALLVLGLAVVGVAGIFYLRKMEIPVLNPDALEDWEGKHLKVSVPKNWQFEYRKERGDSLEEVSFTSQQQVGMAFVYQCWSILLREVAQENLDKFKGEFPFTEISRDTLVEWGEYKGFGIRTAFEDKGGQQFQFMVFSFSEKDQSLVIKEVGSKKALESLGANMGFVRKSLELTSSCREYSEKPVLNLDSSSKAKLDSVFGVRKDTNRW